MQRILKINPIVVLLLSIFLLGAFLRFYNLEKVYSEYDDVGVIALHKSFVSEQKKVSLYNDGVLNLEISLDGEGLKENLLDTLLYPAYMGFTWTYPLGQYILYPLFIDEQDSFEQKLVTSRSFSAIASIISILLLIYILYYLNNKRFDANIVLPVALFVFAYNAILYAHHSSPYSLVVTITLCSILIFILYLSNKITTMQFFILHAVFIIFNYLIILFIPLYTLLMVLRDKNLTLMELIKKYLPPVTVFGLCFLPIFILFFKPSKGLHGVLPPSEFSLEYLLYFPKQFIIAVSSSLQGLLIFEEITIVAVLVTLLFGAYILYKYFKEEHIKIYLILFVFLLSLEWILLHAMGKLIMDTTRHMLMWAPLIVIVLFFILQKINLDKRLLIGVTLVLSFVATYNSLNIIKSKKSNLDYNQFTKYDVDTIITYGATLEPLLACDDKKVYNLDVNSFNEKTFGASLPKELLLVSQLLPIKEYLEFDENNKYSKNFLSNYNIDILHEFDSDEYFTYNNYPVSSSKNAFFLYKLILKGSNE